MGVGAFSIPAPQDAALRGSCSVFANGKDIFKSQTMKYKS